MMFEREDPCDHNSHVDDITRKNGASWVDGPVFMTWSGLYYDFGTLHGAFWEYLGETFLLLVFCCRTCRSVFLPQPTYYKYRWYHIEHRRKRFHWAIRQDMPSPSMLSFQGHIPQHVGRLCVGFSKDRKSPHLWSVRSTLTTIGYQRHLIPPVVCRPLIEQYVPYTCI
jgi:hypothetical protein